MSDLYTLADKLSARLQPPSTPAPLACIGQKHMRALVHSNRATVLMELAREFTTPEMVTVACVLFARAKVELDRSAALVHEAGALLDELHPLGL